MSLRISSTGLYLYARDFWNNEDVHSLLTIKKQNIVDNYLQKFMPQMFAARAEASFGNQIDIKQIDDFFTGGNDRNQGFIATVQKEVDQYYSESLKEAESLFTSKLNLNNILNHINGDISSLNKDQKEELNKMMAAQDTILNAMSRLSSLYEQYVLDRCASAGYKPPRMLQNGLYSLGNYKNAGVIKAIEEYNIIKSNLSILQQDASLGLHSFAFFKKTAHAFHDTYAELLFKACVYNVKKNHQNLFKGSVLDAKWTGNSKYIIGAGDLTVQVNSHLDQDFQKIINNALPDFTEHLITATNDVTISSTIDNVIGTYGGNVKEYSDQTVLKLDGFTVVSSSSGTIYYAAQRATQYGLPTTLASNIWIKNLAGAITNNSEKNKAYNYWDTYKQLLGDLLILDAIMGALGKLTVSSNANNLVFFVNGKVFYIGDLIRNITEQSIHAFTGNPYGQWNPYAQDSVAYRAEKAHWENFNAGKSAAEGEAAIDEVLKGIQLKISINLTSILSKIM